MLARRPCGVQAEGFQCFSSMTKMLPGRYFDPGGVHSLSFLGAAPLRSCTDHRRMTMMLDERFVRLQTYRNNIARYRRLLETDLTDFERRYIERRLSEEQSEFELLSAGNLPRHS